MNGLIKLAAIGGGLYLLVKHTTIPAPTLPAGGTMAPPNSTGAPTSAPATGAPPSSAPPATAPPAAPSNPDQPTAATAPLPATDKEALARLAAAGNAQAVAQAESLGIQYNADQWNWLRAAGGGGYTTTDLFPAGNRNALMGPREYLMRRNTAGLAGIRSGWRRRT